VKRISNTFPVNNIESFKMKMLNWVKPFNIFCFLDNNNYQFQQPEFDFILAAGEYNSIQLQQENLFERLKQFSLDNQDWLFGHFNYPSTQKDEIDFPDAYFFVPKHIIKIKNNKAIIDSLEKSPEDLFSEIEKQNDFIRRELHSEINIKSSITKEDYFERLIAIKKHIQRGDCYEINFCQQFYADNVLTDPYFLFYQLNQNSPNPFAAFYKLNNQFCLCASPERFLKKTNSEVISQPIKGTSKRNLESQEIDLELKQQLKTSPKEQSENVMIVDLVRNDLSKVCTEGSVEVAELFGIYSFPQVHQMISTVKGTVENQTHWTEIIDACFPMGSMTGAPKKRVMELIEKYESGPRGLFSGSIGYVTPENNFDFNVVIRSIFYNTTKQKLLFKAGGGITHLSEIEKEYEESYLKVQAIIKTLQ
jgi:para-aminobenzoate synthetase component 1